MKWTVLSMCCLPYLEDAVEFSRQADRVLVQLIPGLETTLVSRDKGLPAVEVVYKQRAKLTETRE